MGAKGQGTSAFDLRRGGRLVLNLPACVGIAPAFKVKIAGVDLGLFGGAAFAFNKPIWDLSPSFKETAL